MCIYNRAKDKGERTTRVYILVTSIDYILHIDLLVNGCIPDKFVPVVRFINSDDLLWYNVQKCTVLCVMFTNMDVRECTGDVRTNRWVRMCMFTSLLGGREVVNST